MHRRKKATIEHDRDQAERFARDMDAAEEIPEADSETLHPLICVLILSFIVVPLLLVGTIGYFLLRLFL